MNKIFLLVLIVFIISLSACSTVIDANQATNELGEQIEINMETLKNTVSTTMYEEQEAIKLSEFIALENPALYDYRIVASDGYSPDPFTYEDIQNGYWLLEKDETFFPEINLGENRLREPRTIIPLKK